MEPASLFAATGTAQNWSGSDTYFNLTLPFAFTLYGTSYTQVQVSTEGFLQFAESGTTGYAGDPNNSDASLIANRRIAPLWANLTTSQIFVDTTVSGQVTIRWQGTNNADDSPVNFDVVLFQNGDIRFDYGGGNTNLNPTVGLSYSNGWAYQLPAGYDGQATLTNAPSLLFTLAPGFADMGAYDFQGSSVDTTPPTVVSTNPTAVDGELNSAPFSQFQVTFSEPLNPIDASAPALYELIEAGSQGFGSPDDVIYSLTPMYTQGGTVVTLLIGGLDGGTLPAGTYEFTIISNATSSIHDLSGNALDGSGDGSPGSDYVRIFTIGGTPTTTVVTPATDSVPDGQSAEFTATVSSTNGVPPDGFVQFFVDGSAYGSAVPIDDGTAQLAVTEAPGSYTIAAEYTGDSSYAATSPANETTATLTVLQIATTTVLTPSMLTVAVGASATFTATVSSADGPPPDGSVQFLVDGNPYLSPVPLSNGTVQLAITEAAGSYSITAEYEGDGTNYAASPLTAASDLVVTNSTIDTTTTVQSSEDPSQFGDSVTFTATVSPAQGSVAPTGTVQFSIDGTPVGTPVVLANGVATLTTALLAVGGHTITAVYSSDSSDFNSSTGSLTGGQTVNTADSTTAVTTSISSPTYGQSLVFTATVTAVTAGLPVPTGTVQFEIDGVDFGAAVTLVNGSATSEAIDSLDAGSHSIGAVYSGDANFATSTALSLTQTVNPAVLAVTANDATKVYGQPNPAFSASYSGFVLGQDPSVLAGTLSFSTTATTASHVVAGGYAITPSGLTSTNYAINFVDGTLTITPAPLTITANSVSTVYGVLLPAFTASYSGFVNGDMPANLTTPVMLSTTATSSSPVGTYSIVASGATSTDYQITFVAGTLTVDQASTTTALTSSVNPSVFGQSVSFTVTVSAAAPGSGTPTGTVQFELNGSDFGSPVALVDGAATSASISTLGIGSDTVTASYSGDTDFLSSTAPSLKQTVEPDSSTTTVTSQPNPAVYGQSVTFSATVQTVAPGTAKPTGSVTFMEGSTALGTVHLVSGTASFTTKSLPVGADAITVVYNGSASVAASTSAVLTQTVNQDATTTSVTSSLNPSTYGQSVTFTSVVKATAPGTGTPTGSVTFMDGTTQLGTVTLSAGRASFKTNELDAGSHSITVVYSGDQNFLTSTSAPLSQTVSQAGTTTKLSSSLNPSESGEQVTFTAVVNAKAPGRGTPTGTVTFMDGSSTLGMATLSDGVATLATSTLSVGTHSITAVYSGDTDFTTSTSPVLKQKVKQSSDASIATSTVDSSSIGWSVTGRSTDNLTASTSTFSGAGGPQSPVVSAATATTPLVDLALGTLQDDPAEMSVLDELAGDVLAARRRSRVR